jgi:hypothetical protein
MYYFLKFFQLVFDFCFLFHMKVGPVCLLKNGLPGAATRNGDSYMRIHSQEVSYIWTGCTSGIRILNKLEEQCGVKLHKTENRKLCSELQYTSQFYECISREEYNITTCLFRSRSKHYSILNLLKKFTPFCCLLMLFLSLIIHIHSTTNMLISRHRNSGQKGKAKITMRSFRKLYSWMEITD